MLAGGDRDAAGMDGVMITGVKIPYNLKERHMNRFRGIALMTSSILRCTKHARTAGGEILKKYFLPRFTRIILSPAAVKGSHTRGHDAELPRGINCEPIW